MFSNGWLDDFVLFGLTWNESSDQLLFKLLLLLLLRLLLVFDCIFPLNCWVFFSSDGAILFGGADWSKVFEKLNHLVSLYLKRIIDRSLKKIFLLMIPPLYYVP